MTRRVLKRAMLQWSATLAALLVLLISGLLASFWLGSLQGQSVDQSMPTGTITAWRLVLYGTVLFTWPYLIRFRLRRQKKAELPNTSRWPLVTTIAVYELFIVHNPLAWLGDLLAGRAG